MNYFQMSYQRYENYLYTLKLDKYLKFCENPENIQYSAKKGEMFPVIRINRTFEDEKYIYGNS